MRCSWFYRRLAASPLLSNVLYGGSTPFLGPMHETVAAACDNVKPCCGNPLGQPLNTRYIDRSVIAPMQDESRAGDLCRKFGEFTLHIGLHVKQLQDIPRHSLCI